MKKEKNSAESLDQDDLVGNDLSDPAADHAQATFESESVDGSKSPDRTTFDSAEAVYQAKLRRREARRSRDDRPLAQLNKVENELKHRSQALQALSDPKQKKLDKDLLAYQLSHSVNTTRTSRTVASRIKHDIMRLYTALDSSDAIETILNRNIVTLSNGALECHARAAVTNNPKALDLNLRYATKMALAAAHLIEVLERRRRPKRLVVSNVNVEAGGQAIVGTVEAHKAPCRSDEGPNDESEAA
jgi:hypothetical protein